MGVSLAMGERGKRAIPIHRALAVAIALGAIASLVAAIACSGGSGSGSGSGGALVGAWQFPSDGGLTEYFFFNSDGTCGIVAEEGGITICSTSCTYTYNGNTVTITQTKDGGTEQTSAQVTISGNTLTAIPTDGGSSKTYTRVNSNPSNSCSGVGS
jgi:hypothetical protein